VSRERQGVLLCLGSAVAFGAMAIFGKLAFRADVGVVTLLALRFTSAAAIFWALALHARPAWPSRRTVWTGLALGGLGYSAQSAGYFAALQRIDASVVALLLYVYPATVTLAAFALGRESPSARRIGALLIASAGVALVLAAGSAGTGPLDGLGVAFALGAALAYTAYILVSDTVVGGLHPLLLAALVSTGAAVTFVLAGVVSGRLDLGFEPIGWLWLAGVVLVSTVLAIAAFFAGLARVGPSAASILSTIEPVVTVALAFVVFGERLSPVQLLGGALVLSAVLLLQVRGRAGVPS